jgi:hypothetical protein
MDIYIPIKNTKLTERHKMELKACPVKDCTVQQPHHHLAELGFVANLCNGERDGTDRYKSVCCNLGKLYSPRQTKSTESKDK